MNVAIITKAVCADYYCVYSLIDWTKQRKPFCWQVHSGENSRTVVHRVGLFSKSGHITTIISQSDVVRWLQRQQHSLGTLKGMTAQQLGWANKQIKSVPAKTPAIEVQDPYTCHCGKLSMQARQLSCRACCCPTAQPGCLERHDCPTARMGKQADQVCARQNACIEVSPMLTPASPCQISHTATR